LPEYPDIIVYVEHLKDLFQEQTLRRIRLANPFFLRTFDPPIDYIGGKKVIGFERMGKRIVFVIEDDYFLILHLMVAGRLHWREKDCKIPPKIGLAALDFSHGSLLITEAGSKKRASLHLIKSREVLEGFNPGGLDVINATFKEFEDRILSENHTLKRALTDPRLFSCIGNAYSDEILHRARLSPIQLTQKMTSKQIKRLYKATQDTLLGWADKLRTETGDKFPENVTAFHEDMAVHGRFGKPCPDCHTKIQRIRYASNETNYCPKCQTGDKLLADRALSRLLKEDWPKSLEELEEKSDRNRK